MPDEEKNNDHDSGFTLVELLVVCLLLGLVLAVVGGLFISLNSTQRTVTAVTTTTSAAQVAVAGIESGVRNASDVSAVFTPSGTDQYFVVRTANRGATLTWSCKAWYFSAAGGGSIRSIQTTDGSKIAAPTASQLQNWSLLVSGVTPASGTGIFTAAPSGITIAFTAAVSGSKPIAIQTTAIKRTAVTEAGTCF